MDCSICVAKTKTLISCAVNAQLTYAFVFAHFLMTQLIYLKYLFTASWLPFLNILTDKTQMTILRKLPPITAISDDI